MTEQNKQSDTPAPAQHLVGIKPLEWVPTHGGKWLRAETPVGVYEVRANDRMIEKEKQRAFDQYSAKVLSCLVLPQPAPHWATKGPLFEVDTNRAGKEPCGECHIQPGETCDICGACNPSPQSRATVPMSETTPVSETDGAAISEREER